RVRRRRGYRWIAARHVEPARGYGRVVIGVDQIMHRAGMVGMLGEGLFKNCGSLQLIGVGFVGGRCERRNGIGLEDLGLRIVRILVVDLLQRLSIGVHSLIVAPAVRIPIEGLGGGDVIL